MGAGIVKKAVAAAAAVLVTTSVLSGAAVVPGSATEDRAVHTKRLVLHETASHNLGKRAFAGTDKIRSRHSHELVGYDSYTGTFYPRKEKAVLDVAMALKGGVIVGRVSLDDFTKYRFDGRILKGTGKYKGIEGTATGRLTDSKKTYLTLKYHL